MDRGQKLEGKTYLNIIINNLKQGGGAGSNAVNNFTKGRITESGRLGLTVHMA
jgi:hypothetical protein